MKRSVVGLAILACMFLAMTVPFGVTLADEQASCSLSVPSTELVNTNHVDVTVSVVGADWVTVALNNQDTADVHNGATSGFDMPFSAGAHQTISGHVAGTSVSCGEPLQIHITEWDPAPTPPPSNGGNQTPPPVTTVGNAALIGHGVDDCRFFIQASAKYYIKANTALKIEANSLLVYVTKMGMGSKPFTVKVESSGKIPWFVQSDPDLGGEGGNGMALYHLPYDEVLKDKSVKQVYVSVFNAITGFRCIDPMPVNIR